MSSVEITWNELRRALCVTVPKWLLERLGAQRAVWAQASQSLTFATTSSFISGAPSTSTKNSVEMVQKLPVWDSVADEMACLETAGRFLRLIAALKHALALRPDEEELRALLAVLTFRPSLPGVLRVLRVVVESRDLRAARALAALSHALSEFFCVAFASALCTGNMFTCALLVGPSFPHFLLLFKLPP